MRTTIRKKERFKLKNIILDNIYHNLKSYCIITILFLIGIIAGVIFINHIGESQMTEISEYIEKFITLLKNNYQVDRGALLQKSLLENVKLTLGMWFIGSTVIGIPIVFGIVLFRGFCIGYTVSSIIATLGTQKGIIFFATAILAQNMIMIPVIIALAVSGMRLYQSIMKDKRKENIKIEIVRHTIVSLLLLVLLVVASIVEVYISTNLLTACANFF